MFLKIVLYKIWWDWELVAVGTELCYEIRQQNVSFNDENDMVLHQSESWFWHCVLLLHPCWLLLHVVINPVNDTIISSCPVSSTWNSEMFMFVREMLGMWQWYLPGMGSCTDQQQLPQPGRELIHQSMRCCQHGNHHQVFEEIKDPVRSLPVTNY